MARVRVVLGGKLSKFKTLVEGGSVWTLTLVFEAWSRIFGAFIRRRFVKASRGDGTWKPLSEATLKRRRKGKGKSSTAAKPAILRDTGLLFMHLTPEVSGLAVENFAPRFVATISFGGTARYPDGSVSTSDVAGFHQVGGPNLPKRVIIVPPDEKTRGQMAKAAKRIISDDLTNG